MLSATARRVSSLYRLVFISRLNPPKLKKLVNRVVQELTLLGFSPEVVRDLVKQGDDVPHAMGEDHSPNEQTTAVTRCHTTTNPGLRLSYEVDRDLGHLVPRLRLVVENGIDVNTMVSETRVAMTWILT